MAKRHRDILDKLDTAAIIRYNITERDVQNIEKYLGILQELFKGTSTWQDLLNFPGVYATAIMIHEVVEFRILEHRGLRPLRQGREKLQTILAANIDAHTQAIYAEVTYLQETINRVYKKGFEIATLMKVNNTDEDFELFLESELGIFLLETERLEEAAQIIAQLKGEI